MNIVDYQNYARHVIVSIHWRWRRPSYRWAYFNRPGAGQDYLWFGPLCITVFRRDYAERAAAIGDTK